MSPSARLGNEIIFPTMMMSDYFEEPDLQEYRRSLNQAPLILIMAAVKVFRCGAGRVVIFLYGLC